MITFFTTPKPFRGQAAISQFNALNSWKRTHPESEILVFGDEYGTAEAVQSLGLIHMPDVETSKHGTPLVSSMFRMACERASYSLRVFVNADIMLLDHFARVLMSITLDRFLMVSRRTTLQVDTLLGFDSGDWTQRLRVRTQSEGVLGSQTAIDYFAFWEDTLKYLPPLIVGRAGWDSWMIYHCRKLRIPVVDVSEVVTIVHQQHDYQHVPGGANEVRLGEEAKHNLRIAGGEERLFTIRDADWHLTSKGLRHRYNYRFLVRSLTTLPILRPTFFWVKPIEFVFLSLRKLLALVIHGIGRLPSSWGRRSRK